MTSVLVCLFLCENAVIFDNSRIIAEKFDYLCAKIQTTQ